MVVIHLIILIIAESEDIPNTIETRSMYTLFS